MKKQTAIKYADTLTKKSAGTFYADYDGDMKTWYVYNVFRRFYTVKDLKTYVGKC